MQIRLTTLAALTTLLVLVVPVQGQIQFALTEVGPSGVPWDAELADVNGDGQLDLIATRSHSVSRRLGDGSGGFHSHATFAAVQDAEELAVEDFDADGIVDIAVVGYTEGDVAILFGIGGGNFAPATRLAMTREGGRFVEAGDFNGDGAIDLLTVTADYFVELITEINVFFGDGNGAFSTPHVLPMDGGRLSWVADVNGDGFDDFGRSPASADRLDRRGFEITFGDASGDFASRSLIFTGAPTSSMVAGHFVGDSHIDLAFVSSNGIGVLAGRGGGTFAPARMSPVRIGQIRAIGDFNADGVLDILGDTGHRISAVAVYEGIGNGRFRGVSRRRGLHAPVVVTGPFAFQSLTAGDMDSDGYADFVFAQVSAEPRFYAALNQNNTPQAPADDR